MKSTFRDITIILTILFCISCKEKRVDPLAFLPPVFPIEVTVTAIQLESDILTSSAMDMEVIDSVLLLRSYNGTHGFQTINKHTGEHVSSLVPIGRGPGELPGGVRMFYVGDDIHIHSINSREFFRYNKDEFLSGGQPYNMARTDFQLPILVSIQNNYIGVAPSALRLPRFWHINSIGEELSHISIYPEYHEYKDSLVIKEINYSTQTMDVSPDQTKFVVTHYFGTMIEIFGYENEEATLIKEGRYYPPIANLKNMNPLLPADESMLGFFGVDCTEDYIYTAFYGQTRGEAKKTGLPFTAKYLYVFDWDLNPIISYRVKEGIDIFALDKEQNRIYFTSYDENGDMVFYYFDM